ncbi:MAG: PQQ-binding-like beta-propeller repeat protein [Akkermansiaceae bacterium]|nr:PQQ-binding-like beta-propeller repeat protein [Akkermansiaceae bacterium]
MWRHDAGHTASTDDPLPENLHLEWERRFSPREPVWDDPLNHDLMTYDRLFEPVVLGKRLFIGFNDSDKVMALDLETGAEAWTFYTDGPVRLPAAAADGRVCFTSDDGTLYCVKAETGELIWSFRGAPSARKALGNRRIVSAWPARGGPVLRDGRVYFAASIWPFMGTFLYALDAATGEVVWVNDATGADFIKQPHSAPSFAGVGPQGVLTAAADLLLVPGGRSVPAAFDRETGELRYFHLNDGGKGNGGSFVASGEKYYYVHTRERGVRVYDLKTGTAGQSTMNEPVITPERLYAAARSEAGEPVVRELGTSERVYWEVKADGSGDLIRAGRHLYAAGKDSISVIALPGNEKEKPRITAKLPVEGSVQRLLAANGKLIAVTLDGLIQIYGTGPKKGEIKPAPAEVLEPRPEAIARAKALLASLDDRGGYGLVFGWDDDGLVEALLAESEMRLAVIDPDPATVDRQRRRFDRAGLYGGRITFHVGTPVTFQAPPYVAHLVVIGESSAAAFREHSEWISAAYQSVRPYGGVLRWPDAQVPEAAKDLEKAVVREAGEACLVVREGALPGAADWTHQYGDIANTVKSNDARVRAPLGVLWFGGNSNLDVLPRHGHGPPEQVTGGRLIIEGMNSLSARDVYTGRVMWKHDFGDLGTFGIYYNETYADTPLDTAYNQKHIPGANGRGTNFVATPDSVYVAAGGECRVLDARNGEQVKTIPLRETPDDPAQWAFVGVSDDLLLGGDDFSHPSMRLGGAKSREESTIEDYSASHGLAVFDRKEGRLLWRATARHSFLHNGIVAGNGRIYCLDKLTEHGEALLRRRGTDLPKDYRIVAFDAHTGEVAWEASENIFGTWLGYSADHDILLLAGSKASDRLESEAGDGMAAYGGGKGNLLWRELKRTYTGPCILHRGSIFTGTNSYANSGGVFDLLTGQPRLVTNPLTGKEEPWRLNRTYGCNTIVASEHLLTFRSGAAGYYDLHSMSGTGNLGGFKSGCTSNLVVANGVLNAPDYTRTCSCGYQNQTSLALIHMPEMEMWTYSQFGLDGKQGDRVLRAGVNFGAPGNRRAADGTLWLEHPHAGMGNSPRLGVEGSLADTARYFERHSSQVTEMGSVPSWIGASGLEGEGEIVIVPSLRRPVLEKPAKSSDEAPKPEESLVKVDFPSRPHTVRLYFREPEARKPGERAFRVELQGKTVIEHLDLANENGAAMREFHGIEIGPNLRLRLTKLENSKMPPVISGVEFVADPE